MSIPNSQNICFTTTAMPRPELLLQTYASFRKNLPWLDFKKIELFINIDRFPHTIDDAEKKTDEVIRVANEFFGKVTYNRHHFSNFPQAVKWIFSQPQTEYVFNLEDDWELLCELPEYFVDFFKNPKILQVGLRATKRSDPRFVLSPSIMRASFCREMSAKLNTSKNPEEQIRSYVAHMVHESFAYWPYESEKVVLKDLGRAWMKNTPFARGMDSWTSWRFLPNIITRAREQMIQDQNVEIDISKLDGKFRKPHVPNQ